MKYLSCWVVVALLLHLSVSRAMAATSIVLSPTGAAGEYRVYAPGGMQDIAGIDLTITYDRNQVPDPSGIRVSAGALTQNAFMEKNPGVPGILRIVFLSLTPITATAGDLAVVNFGKALATPPVLSPPALFSSTGTQIAADRTSSDSSDTKALGSAVPGACGTAHGTVATSPPATAQLCTNGTPSALSGAGPWSWTCSGSNGGSSATCTTMMASTVVNGACGTANNATFTSAPGSNLCSSGTISNLSGSGPWYWACAGTNGGTTASCTAFLSSTSTTGASLGSVTFSDAVQPKREEKQSEEPKKDARPDDQHEKAPAATDAVAPPAEQPAKAVDAKAAADRLTRIKSIGSPLQRFRDFRGDRSLKNLVQLFSVETAREAGVEQLPPIAIGDGKTLLSVTIDLAGIDSTPSFSLKGANQKGLRKVSPTAWELKAVPQKGKYDVHLTVMLGEELLDVPLVVVPPLDKNRLAQESLTDKGVSALLGTPAVKGAKPTYDLNGDGRQGADDDYILIGHYLLKTHKRSAPK